MASENSVLKKTMSSLFKILIFFAVACTTGHCRRDGSQVETPVLTKPSLHPEREKTTVLVSRPDQSQQCGIAPGVSLEEMAKDLGDIKIISSEKRSDGLLRIQACGTPTGLHNIYEIDGVDLEKAQSLGFQIFKN